ncbi:MAG: type VI secretion system baseplate subunit TssG [Aestuariivita sp.]|nr:type VI secretion system baseplate subunit TssG [Aestuariivita sp.]
MLSDINQTEKNDNPNAPQKVLGDNETVDKRHHNPVGVIEQTEETAGQDTENIITESAPPVVSENSLIEASETSNKIVDNVNTTEIENVEEMHPLVIDLLLNPTQWEIWPAVAVLRWMISQFPEQRRELFYQSKPSLGFPASEIHDIDLSNESSNLKLTLTAPGLACYGSALPTAYIARIVADTYRPRGGAIAAWLDGFTNRFMQALESAKMLSSAAFALATAGNVPALRRVSDIAGHTAPLRALPSHRLHEEPSSKPSGATGLAAYFLDNPSAVGLIACLRAFTNLSVRVEEFVGAQVRVLRPARIGSPIMRILGMRSEVPAAGINVILDGGKIMSARYWARDSARRRSLRLICSRYIGNPSITVRLFLDLDKDNVDRAKLGESALGGMAILGIPSKLIRLPLRG